MTGGLSDHLAVRERDPLVGFCAVWVWMVQFNYCLFSHCCSCFPVSQWNRPSLTFQSKTHSHGPYDSGSVQASVDDWLQSLEQSSTDLKVHYSSFVNIRLTEQDFRDKSNDVETVARALSQDGVSCSHRNVVHTCHTLM